MNIDLENGNFSRAVFIVNIIVHSQSTATVTSFKRKKLLFF